MELDDVDKGIMHALQLDARNTPAHAIAEQVDVSASTVRNRIERLEDEGVIEGYHPKVNYELAGLPLHILFVCSTPGEKKDDLLEEVLSVRGVIDVRETVTGRRNLYVEAVGTDTADAVRITDELHEIDISIDQSEILRRHRRQPFNHFGADALGELEPDSDGGGDEGEDERTDGGSRDGPGADVDERQNGDDHRRNDDGE